MLLKCSLIHITIIILRLILYFVYLCPCLSRGLLMSYLCDLFYIFSLISIAINYITSLKQAHLAFAQFFKYLLLFLDNNLNRESEKFSKSKSLASGYCVACLIFCQFQADVAYKSVAYIKKRVE